MYVMYMHVSSVEVAIFVIVQVQLFTCIIDIDVFACTQSNASTCLCIVCSLDWRSAMEWEYWGLIQQSGLFLTWLPSLPGLFSDARFRL